MFFSILGQIIIGWLIADFFSGLFHWWEDRVGNTSMPIIGKSVIIPNRLHHVNPLDFTYDSNFISRNLAVWGGVAVISLIWIYLFGVSWVFDAAVFGGLIANEIHRISHTPPKTKNLISILQETGIIQSPHHHAKHHRGNFDKHYNVLTNFLNPFLDYIHFWNILESILTLIGLEPNKGTK